LIVSFLGGNIAMPYLDGVSIHNLLRGFPSASFPHRIPKLALGNRHNDEHSECQREHP